MNKVLVIDDDPDVLELVRFNLEKSGFRCFTAENGRQGLLLVRDSDPQLILLDIMLPGCNGFELLRTLKLEHGSRKIPVIMLTAKTEESDRIKGFELGADDYVPKPFSVRELVLRVQRLLDRSGAGRENHILHSGKIVLDTQKYEVKVGDTRVFLTAKEFSLLTCLLRNSGRVLSRDQLLERVWGHEYDGTSRTIDTHVQRLRVKLGPGAAAIETIRGVGYRAESKRDGFTPPSYSDSY